MTRIGYEDPHLQRMEQATLWLQRMRSEPDDRIVEDWLNWCQRDPLNQKAFDEIAAIWELSGKPPRDLATADGPPADLPRAEAQRARVSRRALVASLAGLGLAGITGAWWWSQARDPVVTSEFAAPIGVNRVQKLADGSVLTLGGGTRVTVTLGRRERHVHLHEGELFVAVRHDARRPFWVTSGILEVVATGTAFNVLRTAARTTVTVTEGSVAAYHEGRAEEANVVMKAGQQLVYAHAAHSVEVQTVDPVHAIAWRTGMLNFTGEPMAEVIARINRYTTRTIEIDDARIRAFPFNGTALANAEGVDKWLRGLRDTTFEFPVSVTELPNGHRLIVPRPGTAD